MKLQEYLKKALEEISKQCTARAEIDLELDEKLNVVDGGKQKIHLEVIQLK